MMGSEEVHDYGEGTYHQQWRPRDGRMTWKRTSWGAIFAGTFVTLGIFLTLQILGAGIGLFTIDLTGRTASGAGSLSVGAGLWWFFMGLISLFIGGWVAGRLSGLPSALDRVFHGLTVWAFFYMVMFWVVAMSLGALAGGGALLGKGTAAAGHVAAASPQTQQPGSAGAQAGQIAGNPEQNAPQARETGQQVANVTGAALIGLAIAMIIGAIVAMLGSLAGTAPKFVPPHEYEHPGAAKTEAGTYAAR
jgi:hypothetical protein